MPKQGLKINFGLKDRNTPRDCMKWRSGQRFQVLLHKKIPLHNEMSNALIEQKLQKGTIPSISEVKRVYINISPYFYLHMHSVKGKMH